ncbi:MAG: 4Fe-4S dicluster domain-containing protein [Actinomycetota bacterium]|nr:4Fe-4S dicluster domain-containing protein [Actinomycetota bacterium]
MEDLYSRLMKRLDNFPAGAPESDNLLELLRIIFDDREAELALDLAGGPEPLESISNRLGRDAGELEAILEGMADKGLVYAKQKEGVKSYNLLPLVPGIFELQFMKAEVNPEKRRVAELFDKYYHEGWGEANFTSDTAMARVMMVEEEIPSKEEVLPYEKVSEFVKGSTAYMALTHCFCRHEAELLGRACGAPKDVCMIFGPFAKFLVERGFAWKASEEDMLDALRRAEEAGLVHLTDNIQDKISFICNCCGCCCGFLGTITKLGIPGAVASSRFAARVDEDLCTGCEDCLEVCQMSAITVDDDRATIDVGKCIGCGLCASHCPSGAVEIFERDDWKVPASNIVELGVSILKERGKL